MRMEVSGQQDVELELAITLVVDFTAYGWAEANFDGDPEAGYVHKFVDIEVRRIDIDDVTIKGKPDSHVALTQDSINELIEVVRPYAEELIKDEAEAA